MENGAATQGEGKDPSGFLSEIIGNPVTVKLNSGVVYKGKSCACKASSLNKNGTGPTGDRRILTFFSVSRCPGELQSVDGYMNIALEKTEEYVNGVKRRTYGDAFVRGNNGLSLSSSCPVESPLTYLRSHVHLCRLRHACAVGIQNPKARPGWGPSCGSPDPS